MAILFPGTGVMPISALDLIPPGVACAAVAVVCPTPIVRRSAVFALLAMPIVLLFPGAVGTNITRLAWVCAVPVIVGICDVVPTMAGCCRRGDRRSGR